MLLFTVESIGLVCVKLYRTGTGTQFYKIFRPHFTWYLNKGYNLIFLPALQMISIEVEAVVKLVNSLNH